MLMQCCELLAKLHVMFMARAGNVATSHRRLLDELYPYTAVQTCMYYVENELLLFYTSQISLHHQTSNESFVSDLF